MEGNRKEIRVIEIGKAKVVESPTLTKPLAVDEVVVKLDCACFNPADWFILHGKFPGQPHPPFRLGLEALCSIQRVGDEALKNLVGRKCLVITLKGSYATEFVVSRNEVFVLDQDTDLGTATENFIVNPMTAYELVQIAKERKAKCIIHTGASSNVGKWITVIAKSEGIETIAVVRNEKHLEELSALGANFVLNSSDKIYEMALKTAINQFQPTVLLDALCGEKPMTIFSLMPPGSSLINYGSMEKAALEGVNYGSLIGGKTISAFIVVLDTFGKKSTEYVESVINKLFKMKEKVRQPIIFFNFEDINDLIHDWPQRTTRLGIEAKL